MSKLFYFLGTFAESCLSVFGIRSAYDQPPYRVVKVVAPDVEIRAYASRMVVETPVGEGGDGAAFQRLFGYITGANHASRTIAMTVPVEQHARQVGSTVPISVEAGPAAMSFYLPPSAVGSGAPVPTDPNIEIRTLPAATLAVIRYSGLSTTTSRNAQTARLQMALKNAGIVAQGTPDYFYYDPPFALPFLRRNEIALSVAP